MKTCISIKSFCDTAEKQKILIRCINMIREKTDFPIILHSAFNIPSEIISSVDFYIYYKNSCYSKFGDTNLWQTAPGYKGVFRSFVRDYGFSEMKQLLDVANFAKTHGFSAVHTINYDIDIDQLFSENSLMENHDELLKGNEACFHAPKDFYMGLLLYSYRISAVLKFEHLVKTEEDWEAMCKSYSPHLVENGFFNFFSNLRYKITREFLFNDLVQTKTIDRSGIPEGFENLIETAGIYRKNYDLCNGCVLFVEFKDFDYDKCQIIIEEETFNISRVFFMNLSCYPSNVKIKIGSIEKNLFPEWKMEDMKKSLAYEV